MKKFFTNLSIVFLMLSSFLVAGPMQNAYAADSDCSNSGSFFFSLKPWYAGITEADCSIKAPDADGLGKFVWTIVLNILFDIMIIIGYIAVIMVALGGYLYMFSRGEPGRAERGKKTLITAAIGLAVSLLASVIMNTISTILIGG